MNDYSISWLTVVLCIGVAHGLPGCKSRSDSEGSVNITSDQGSIKVEGDKGSVTVQGSDQPSADDDGEKENTTEKPAGKGATKARGGDQGSVTVKGADGRPVKVKDENGVVSVQGDKGLIKVENGKLTVGGDKESITVGEGKGSAP